MALHQKLVTIGLFGSPPEHGNVEIHLENYLSDGWRIAQVLPAGVASGNTTIDEDNMCADFGGWLVVILERTS